MDIPTGVVVDTNVATTANGMNDGAPLDCVAASARALQHVIDRGHLYLDDGGAIVSEYRAHLSAAGQPGPGDVFFKWVLTHEWGDSRVTHVAITPKAHDPKTTRSCRHPRAGSGMTLQTASSSRLRSLTASILRSSNPSTASGGAGRRTWTPLA